MNKTENARKIPPHGADAPCNEKGAPALFLDRDGVLIEDHGYIRDPSAIVYKEDVLRGLAGFDFLRTKEVPMVIVSNQAGIAKGILTPADVEAVNACLLAYMRGCGLDVAGVWYCPYHAEGVVPEYTRSSDMRKPHPGMFFQAAEALHIDLSRSLMVGDKESDRIVLPYLESFILAGQYVPAGGTVDALMRRIAEKFRAE
jgi:D,D-heptose 1,7-bisphosphate phosphatase